MARFGTWSPLSTKWSAQPRMTQVDILSIHTMAGSMAGTDALFRRNGFGGTFSHFGLDGKGAVTQWQDTAYRAAANLNGNWHIVSVECADVGAEFPKWNTNDGSAVPPFTSAQCETLAQLIAAMCKAHNIPCLLIPDAKPGRRGIGYHRMGVPGYMVSGAEQWSSARGKVCPGDRRIAQIPAIIARAQQWLSGAVEAESIHAASIQEEDDMTPDQSAKLDRLALIAERLLVEDMGDYDPKTGRSTEQGWPVDDGTGRKLKRTDIIRDMHHEIRSPFGGQTMVGRLMVLEQQNAGLQAAVSNLAAAVAQGGGASAAELTKVIHDAMADTVKVQVSVDGSAA